ncbi:MAG: GNAT family N-acetyltransferase, partial [Candidatus Heimdallarchaeota archaeon]
MVKKNLESGKIVFPYDEKTKLIRPLKHSENDFKALARCMNAFKDADSWPDGFGGNLVFTGELLENEFKSKDLSTNFIITSIQDPSEIVGVGFCSKMWNLTNGWYVQFFGVDPTFQKQKYGKALLLNATKAAYESNAQIITLHTWGGNLKAMPLYKRQGYKWRPDTSVYMENYLPQILNYPLFQDFFSKNCWYDIFKPSITQEPNLEFDEKMEIYEYQFLVDENNKLTIWVDRTIGRISGFHKQSSLEGEDILIRAKVPNSKAFIGLEEFPITLQFVNNSITRKILSIKVMPSPQIELKGKKEFDIELTPNSEQKVDFIAKFKTDTLELDTKIHTHTYSDHEILFLISDGDLEFPVRVGKIPINAIKVITDPMNFAAVTKQSISIPLNIQNFTGEEKDVEISVSDGEKISFRDHSFDITVKQYDSSINLLATVSSTPTTIDTFKVIIKTQEGHLFLEKNLPISIFNDNRTLSYELEQQIFIENKNIRVSLFKNPQPGQNEVIIYDKVRRTKVYGHPIILGYPFDDEGSEFYTIKLEHQIIETSDGLWLNSTAESNIKRGIRITRKLLVPHDGGPIGIQWLVKNSSERKTTDLGLLSASYWGHNEYQIVHFIYS